MSAKAEIADYSISTSFGKGEPIKHDRRWRRPRTRETAIEQIEATYRHTKWGAVEQAANAAMLGLEAKRTGAYANDELKLILGDMERFRMIIYED